MADINPVTLATFISNSKNPNITAAYNNPANPGYPVNGDIQNYAANQNIPASINNPTNPGWPINGARLS